MGRVGSIALGYAELALGDLLAAGEQPRGDLAVALGYGWKVTVVVERDAPAEPLTECEAQVEELLLTAQYAVQVCLGTKPAAVL